MKYIFIQSKLPKNQKQLYKSYNQQKYDFICNPSLIGIAGNVKSDIFHAVDSLQICDFLTSQTKSFIKSKDKSTTLHLSLKL